MRLPPPSQDVLDALAQMPRRLFNTDAAHDGNRSVFFVRWVHPCTESTSLVRVAAPHGDDAEPLVRSGRAFSLSCNDSTDALLCRTFADFIPQVEDGDPFDAHPVETLTTGSSILRKSDLILDGALVRNVDLDADHGLYVGRVVDAPTRQTAGK